LAGIKTHSYNIIGWREFQFFAVTVVKNNVDNFVWGLIVVYGSPYEETKVEFINELHLVMGG
jgi:hypothetical protein